MENILGQGMYYCNFILLVYDVISKPMLGPYLVTIKKTKTRFVWLAVPIKIDMCQLKKETETVKNGQHHKHWILGWFQFKLVICFLNMCKLAWGLVV